MIRRKAFIGLIVSTVLLTSCVEKIDNKGRAPDALFYLYKKPAFDREKYVSALTVFTARHGMQMSRLDVRDKDAAVTLVNEDVRINMIEPFNDGEVFVSLFDVRVGSGASKTYGSELFSVVSGLTGATVSYTRAEIGAPEK